MAAAAVPRRLRIATSLSRERLARRAGALLAAVTITVSSTVAFIAAFAWFVARHPNDSRWAQFTTASTAVVAATVFVVSGALILWWAGSGLRSVISRRRSAGVTVASPHIVEVVAQLALAAGITGPSVVACDDPAPNTTVTFRRGAVRIVLTTGACELPSDMLAALVAFDLAVASSAGLRRAQVARASVTLLTLTMKLLWILTAASFALVAVTRRAMPFGVGLLVGAAGLIVLIPLGAVVGGSAVALAIAANTMADRDAVAMTFLPDVYLDVLLGMIDDKQLTDTSPSPLVWFERTTRRDDLPAMLGSASSQHELVHRAEQMAAIAALPLPDRWPPSIAMTSATSIGTQRRTRARQRRGHHRTAR